MYFSVAQRVETCARVVRYLPSQPNPGSVADRQRSGIPATFSPVMFIPISHSQGLIYKADISEDRRFWTFGNLLPLQMISTSLCDERMHAAESLGPFWYPSTEIHLDVFAHPVLSH